MINLESEEEKQKFFRRHLLLSQNLERTYIITLRRFFNSQYTKAAASVRHGNLRIDDIVDSYLSRFSREIQIHYMRTGRVFGDDVIDGISKKDPFDVYRERLLEWIRINAARKVTQTSKTTKALLSKIIANGTEEGLTNAEISKKIISEGRINNLQRAVKIARTETHTAATGTTDIAVRSLNMEMEKGWMAANDERTRVDHNIVDGTRVPNDEPFQVGPDKMMYPGDPNASAGNIVNCRCVLLYYTI